MSIIDRLTNKIKDIKTDIAWLKSDRRRELRIAGKTEQLKKIQKVNKELKTIERLDDSLRREKIKHKQLKHPIITGLFKAVKKRKANIKQVAGGQSIVAKPSNPYKEAPKPDNIFTAGGGLNPIFHGTKKK